MIIYPIGDGGLMIQVKQSPQLLSPIGDIKYLVGDNIPSWGLGINDSGKAESEKQSPIINRIKYHKMGI